MKLAALIAAIYLLAAALFAGLLLAGLQGPVCHTGTVQQGTCNQKGREGET